MDSRAIGASADRAASQRVSWPARSGAIPPLADNYYQRPETGLGLAGELCPGETTVLADALPAAARTGSTGSTGSTASTDSTGGTGKTQLAVDLARTLWANRAIDLLVWVNAASREAIVTGYAQAWTEVGAAGQAEDPESAAARFLAYLAGTGRPWLTVLDDLGDYHDLDGLWPQGPAGRVVVTTRAAATDVNGHHRRTVPVGPFTRREAVNYLTTALKEDPDLRFGALDLAEDLQCLPIALAHATAVMADSRLDCREYRSLFAERKRRLAGGVADAIPPAALTTWSLAVDRAQQFTPGRAAWATLTLFALLDPGGIPGSVVLSQAACSYITGRPDAAAGETQVREAVSTLGRLSLLAVDPASDSRTIRVHAMIQRAIRSFVSPEHRDQAALAAASAVAQAWPDGEVHPLLAQALRDCAASIRECTGELLWSTGCHPLLVRAGESLDRAGLAEAATAYWQALIGANSRILGPDHPDTLLAREKLAESYGLAGRLDDAISGYERTLVDREQILGPAHPDTVAAGRNLAGAYHAAGRLADAIPLYERVLADRVAVLGAGHQESLAARSSLARAYLAAGRVDDAITLHKRNLAERERVQGPDHPDTLVARAELAEAYRGADRPKDAIALYESVLADRGRVQGPDHPDTLTARANLAYAHRTAGRLKQAMPIYERVLADRERVQGPDHPDTLTARGNLAHAYHSARRPKESIALYERTLADRERVQGPDHPDTLTARANLASAYHSGRRLSDAIPLYERTIADLERVKGPDHPDTLGSRSNLGHAYHTAGRMTDAITIFQRASADCERALGPDHPLTQTARENLEAITRG
jgi:tetratricopeptide (TPR) repeat protein